MSAFILTRPQFIDRTLDPNALSLLAEMLTGWRIAHNGHNDPTNTIQAEATVYSFPRPARPAIRQALLAQLPAASFDESNPDQLTIVGPPVGPSQWPDLSVWYATLSEPQLQHACILLRLTLSGKVTLPGTIGPGTTTIILCGAPANGSLCLKAMWYLNNNPILQDVWRVAPWPDETAFLQAFDLYCSLRQSQPPDVAAKQSYAQFCQTYRFLFTTNKNDRLAMWLIRLKAEMPDQRGPAAFALRSLLPLSLGLILLACAARFHHNPEVSLLTLLIGAYLAFTGGRAAWHKLRFISAYRARMLEGLGRMHAGTVQHSIIDCSLETEPSLLKLSAELTDLGAQHLADLRTVTASNTKSYRNRIYALGNSLIFLGFIESSGNLLFFPKEPVILLNTQFADGRRHFTTRTRTARKPALPNISGRSLQGGDLQTLLALHEHCVQQIIKSGAQPEPVPATPAEVLAHIEQGDEESRKAWSIRPYCWSDAFHDAFELCRREYRPSKSELRAAQAAASQFHSHPEPAPVVSTS